MKDLGAVSLEVDVHRDRSGQPDGWTVSMFLEETMVAEATAATVPEAARWLVHRLRRNLERGEEALTLMGLLTTGVGRDTVDP